VHWDSNGKCHVVHIKRNSRIALFASSFYPEQFLFRLPPL
jgi:hypothetical protein